MYFQYYLNVNRAAGSTVGLEAMQKWDTFLADTSFRRWLHDDSMYI